MNLDQVGLFVVKVNREEDPTWGILLKIDEDDFYGITHSMEGGEKPAEIGDNTYTGYIAFNIISYSAEIMLCYEPIKKVQDRIFNFIKKNSKKVKRLL